MDKLGNIIEMPVEFKMDPQGMERRNNFINLRAWTKATVKIEAVKCFPPYVKLSLLRQDASEMFAIRIHIPGLTVQLASSRTKSHTYGMFWRQNRKRCCAFVAFSTKEDCEQHMKWVKCWIKTLEQYRQDILLSRRASRFRGTSTTTTTHQDGFKFEESVLSNVDNTQVVKDICEILGPLPQIPIDMDQEWIRRQSINASGIYEDIEKYRKEDLSRASGIYEKIKEEEALNNEKDSPILPPRKRVNTKDFGLKRSQTNTESDFKSKKKSWTTQLVEGITKRFESTKTSSPKARKSSLDKIDESTTKARLRNRHLKHALQKNKRNSFSSPDLFNIPDTVNLERGNLEFSFLDQPDILNMSAEFLNLSFKRFSSDSNSSGVVADFESDTNSLNSSFPGEIQSNVEPVTAEEPIYQVPSNIPVRYIDEITGYCIMSPKRAPQPPSTINLCRDYGKPEESTYMAMAAAKPCILEESITEKPVEPMYVNFETVKRISDEKKEAEAEEKPITPVKKRLSRPLSTNIDEKIPSYYPNESIYSKPKSLLKTPSPRISNTIRPRARNNIYTSPPVRDSNSISPTKKSSRSSTDLSSCNTKFSPVIPKHQGRLKYATVGRSEGRRCIVAAATTTTEIPTNPPTDTLRRFGSMPKSWLRSKFSSVLQKYQQSGM